MLKSLHIQNFAIVDEANVSFDTGLNIITGETGVGKSLIVDALGIALGERAFKDFIREGYPSAIVEAVFEINQSQKKKILGLVPDSTLITIKREIRLQGSSKVWINGQSRTVQELKDLGDRLVDLHGQHEHQYLLNEEHHIDFLDQFAETGDLKLLVAEKHGVLSGMLKELRERDQHAHSRLEQAQLIAFQLTELNEINPQVDELELLEKERKVLENALSISEQAAALYQQADGVEGSAIHRLNQIIGELEGLSNFTDNASAFLPEALAARVSIQSIADFALDYEKEVSANPRRLGEVESRLKQLNRICQKYNRTYPELLLYWEEIRERLDVGEDPDWSREKHLRSIRKASDAYAQACKKLNQKRRREALVLSAAIVDKLQYLGIPKARFQIEIEQTLQENGLVMLDNQRFRGDESGMDQIAFWMQANPGEPIRPLARTASGGEISRIMLAIKAAMSGKDGIGTVIFDEIDTGISGRIARVVGTELRNLGKHHQLISITHLPQIASLADSHYRVEKHFIKDRTVTRVKRLSDEERISEIAKLIGDGEPGDAVRLAALELLKKEE